MKYYCNCGARFIRKYYYDFHLKNICNNTIDNSKTYMDKNIINDLPSGSNLNITISIDDICPHQYSGKKTIENCKKLLEMNPNLKFIFFIPIAYKRISGRVNILSEPNNPEVNIINKTPLYLSNHKEFCKLVFNLPPENFQFGYHGYFHSKIDRPGRSNNGEFKQLSYQETISKIKLMEAEVSKTILKDRFVKIFRPPGWAISNQGIKAFLDQGYTLHLSKSVPYDFQNIEKSLLKKIYYYDYSPPGSNLENPKKEDIHIVYHACEWLRNYMSIEQIDVLLDFYKEYKLSFHFLK